MATGLEIKSKSKHRALRVLGWLLVAALLVVAGLSAWYLYRWYTTGESTPLPIPLARADPRVDESDIPKEKIDAYTVPANNPRYISIPSLGINKVRVLSLGVDSNNQLAAPPNINDTGWYNNSATPGSGGTVLIDGHNGGITRDGVFAKIRELPKGAEISLERGDGKKFTYAVVTNKSEKLDVVNKTGMKELMQPITAGKEGLSLITCDGVWVPKDQVFDRRIMLRAELVD